MLGSAHKVTWRAGAGREGGVVSGHDAVARVAAVVSQEVIQVAVHAVLVRAVHELHRRPGRLGMRWWPDC